MNILKMFKRPAKFVRSEKWISEMNELERYQINYPLGSKVIVKDGTEAMYRIGILTGYEHKNGSSVLPKVEIEGVVYLCFGIVRHYDERVTRALDKLDGFEQWNVMAENYHIGD